MVGDGWGWVRPAGDWEGRPGMAGVISHDAAMIWLEVQCSEPSGGPAGPRGETAKSPGRDGTASRSPSGAR